MANQIEIEVVLSDGSVVKGLGKLKTRAEKGGEEAGRAYATSFSNFVSVTLGNVAARAITASLAGIQNQVRQVVGAATDLELFETQFKTILGSSKAAEDQLRSLQEFAATTPFQLPGLTESTRQLLSFGVAQEEIIPTLRQLGDLAAGTGSAIQDLTIPFGRLVSTQKLTLVELDKFADRGINLYGKLAEQTGISLKNIRDEISKGRVPFEEFTQALQDLTSEGGTFFGATEAQSKTLGGLFSTLSDNIFNLQATIGQVFGPFLKAAVNQGILFFQSLTKSVTDNAKGIVETFFTVIDVLGFVTRAASVFKNIFSFAVKFAALGVNDILKSVLALAAGLSELADQIPGVSLPFTQTLKDLRDSARETSVELGEELQAITENDFFGFEFQEQIDLLIEKFRQAGEEIPPEVQKVVDALKTIETTGVKTAKTVVDVSKKVNSAVSSAFAQGISQTIQKLATNLATGKSIFQDFGRFVLGLIGDLAIRIGQVAIAAGLAIESIGKLSGTQAVIAGAALIAIGSIIKSLAGGSGGSEGGGGVSPVSAGGIGGGFVTPDDTFVTPETEQREPETRIAVNITGDVLDSRESGLRIVELINEAFDRDGAIVTGTAV